MAAFWVEMGVAYLEINKLHCLHEIFSCFISRGDVLCYNKAKIYSFILKCLENL
jgi:hypothetical protein